MFPLTSGSAQDNTCKSLVVHIRFYGSEGGSRIYVTGSKTLHPHFTSPQVKKALNHLILSLALRW